ncbi:MAG TPA: AMP-binding protein, partial [Steroidobacteraceae bacterium]
MMEGPPLLHELPAHLQLHGDRHITFHSMSASERLTFREFYGEVVEGMSLAVRLGISRGATVGLVAADRRSVLLLDLVLLGLQCTVVHIPERSATRLASEDASLVFDFLLLEEGDCVPPDFMVEVGSLARLRVYRSTDASRPRDPRTRGSPAVIFSSGTSGHVKKLVVNRHGVIYNARRFFSFVHPDPDDLFLIFLPLSNYQQRLLIYGCLLEGVDFCITDAHGVMAALKQLDP